ncbi:unnamed protein product [Ceutorhynchus assimilis]|uniref:FYVE-type domain-containing protein n=1 Tax=Ceutorhynchus assimilis TaxID=467358 RepID=A0A9N9MMZ1_9CUCU|nr:unnamed protein product [Ceutorhynchus assimilis]
MEELEDLLQNNKEKFYRQFSCSNIQDKNKDFIGKVWELIGKNLLSKNVLYLSLMLHKNDDLLDKCISYDKETLNIEKSLKDPISLFDYTVHTKKHWFYKLIKNSSGFDLPKLAYLQLINITNNEFANNHSHLEEFIIKQCQDINYIDKFWIYYAQEVKYILNLIDDLNINNKDILNHACQNSVLELASEYLDLDCKHANVLSLLQKLKPQTFPHEEDIEGQISVLTSYSILAEFLKILIRNNNSLNINEILTQIQMELLNIKDHKLQLQLLQVIFSCIFLKSSHIDNSSTDKYICNEKELRIILFTLKTVMEEIKFKRIYDEDNLAKLNELYKMVTDASWRLELIISVVPAGKCNDNLLQYLLAEPESLINLCLKSNCDFNRASQVLQIFSLESSSLAQEILYTEKLQELKDIFKKTSKIRNIHQDTPELAVPKIKLNLDDIAEEFFRKHPNNKCEESDKIIQENLECYPFLDHFKSENELLMNILDLAITQTNTFDDSRALLHLASNYNTLNDKESDFSIFARKLLILFNEIGEKSNVTLGNILLNPEIVLDKNQWQKQEEFYEKLQKMYEEFNASLLNSEAGVLNKDHLSHKLCQNLSNYLSENSNNEKYLQKLFNYIKAFSKVLYIEKDTSVLISNNENTSFFALLTFNRSELMGKLLFEQNLDPKEFEKYFQKLKLDFLYHVTGNCFPTINLYTDENVAKDELYPENTLYAPNEAVITYIKKRHWLLALILIEMYKIEDVEIVEVGESRIQHFINYLRLPKIQNLQDLFKCNEIIAAVQNDISYHNTQEYVYAEIKKHDFGSSTQTSHSSDSLETAEEILEDELKTTNWRKLFSILDSIPEKQFKKEPDFVSLRDMVLVNLVKDAFECGYYKFTLEIADRSLRTNLLLENMKTWPEDFCINSIKCELTRFEKEEEEETEVVEELKLWLKHIEHSKKVMHILEVTSWSNMYDMCTFQPKEVLNKLLASKEINLLLEFIELHEVSNAMLLCINEDFLESAFEIPMDLKSIKKLLKFLPQNHAIKVCQNLLGILKNVSHLQFICDYLTKRTNQDDLANVALSLKMLSVFTQNEFDQQLLFLLRDPMSIIEVLIMNTKLDKLAAVLEMIKNCIPVTEIKEEPVTVEKIDDVLRKYAEKSLDFRVIAQPEPRLLSTPEHKLLQSLDSINLDPDAKVFIMPEEVPSKDQWVANSEVIECMCCTNVFFSMFNRRHHCRRCGRVVCYSCSKKRMIVPTYGDILVRVCTDCFKQTFKDAVSEDTTSTKSALDDYWMLTNDLDHNRIVREEFSYEFAPSVSLCLSLMKFHSASDEKAKFLLDQCDILLKLLIPNQDHLQEIDYMLVIRMLKSLALAAKLSSQDTSLRFGSSSADRILTQAELLSLLAERGCLSLLPTNNSAFIDSISLMRLTDKLLEREQWQLALEVSTKAGIDKSGVFVAWGISCLKAGSLVSAREKFSKCLDKNAHHDANYYDIDSASLKVIKNPPLLNEIIKILESKKETLDEEVVIDHSKFSGSTMTLSQSVVSTSPADGAIFILNKLKNLKNIELGYYSLKKRGNSADQKLEKVIYDECVYYLSRYGTGISLVEFHIKYGNFSKALNCIIKKNLSPEVFVETYMKCLKHGNISTLQAHMSEIDSTLTIWKDHLMQICCYLAKRNLLHSLYQLQLYMGDYVRAAMTCFRFYEEKASSFTDLLNNSHFLYKSQEHLRQAKEQEQWITVSTVRTMESEETFDVTSVESPLIKKMTSEEIDKHTATILTQIEASQFLADCEKNGVMPMQLYLEIFPNPDNIPKNKISIPTLFGPSDQRKYLAALCIICAQTIEQGFAFGLRIIKEFRLKPILVYKETGKYLAQTKRFSDIAELVNCIKQSSNGNDEVVAVCDEMLIFAVATLKNTSSTEAHVEELIKHISDKTVKISAYIEAQQLKTAYFLATKYKRLVDLRRIMREAESTNQTAIKLLCQKAIQRYSAENK